MTILSPLAAAVAELAADAAVRAIVGTDSNGFYRVRPIEPWGTVGSATGDARGAGNYIPFVILSVLDSRRLPHAPIRENTLGLKCYGSTYAAAEALYLACEAVFADRSSRSAASGLGIWHSTIVSGGMPDRDPAPPAGTGQPLFSGVISYPTTTVSI